LGDIAVDDKLDEIALLAVIPVKRIEVAVEAPAAAGSCGEGKAMSEIRPREPPSGVRILMISSDFDAKLAIRLAGSFNKMPLLKIL
jgi:hypothetical protein